MMVGSDLPEMTMKQSDKTAAPMLKLDNLNLEPEDIVGMALKNINLEAFGGEIVGIAGVSGNGQKELGAAISGEQLANNASEIIIDGEAVGKLNAGARRKRGLGFVPEERLGRGAIPPYELSENTILTAHSQGMVRRGMLKRNIAREFAKSIISRFSVKANGPDALAHSLSGGNLQKFIMGREIELSPKVLLVSQPTWGVDVGAANYIWQTLIDLSRLGKAVIIISEELDELFEICDRIYVMADGALSHSLERAETSIEEVGLLMTGVQKTVGSQDAV
jgi:simple sugar transport system ATP-binding protein